MIEQIRVEKFCQGTIIDDHWIITTATCCARDYMSPPENYAKAYINFGASSSPFTVSTQARLLQLHFVYMICSISHYKLMSYMTHIV